ncbi:hypothetical protein K474DRAFT_1713570 [Panus rudis PR-1116 ss-1]|nr:hypothetical protein K474DRAFT_1713570 [Panus rudis PR-1116 ss-1]
MSDILAALTPSVPQLLGPFVLVFGVSFILYGVTVYQAYSYFSNYRKDETAYSAFALQAVYHITIVTFGDFVGLDRMIWTGPLLVNLEEVVVLIVQSFYIWRLWKLSKAIIFPTLVIGVLLAARSTTTLVATIHMWRADAFSQFSNDPVATITVEIACIISALTDALIAGSLVFHLRKQRTAIRRTDNAIRGILAYSVNTGLITMFMSSSLAIVYLAAKGNIVYAALVILKCRTYANAFLGALNARRLFVRSAKGVAAVAISFPEDYSEIYPGSQHGTDLTRTLQNEPGSIELAPLRSRPLKDPRAMRTYTIPT